MRLQHKTAIVTGAGRGIGRQIALRFAAEGARVIVADLSVGHAEAVVAEITENNGTAAATQVDVGEAASAERMVEFARTKFGTIDVLVNNAGIGSNRAVIDTPLDEWERVLRVNLTGTFLCAQAAARAMVAQGSGRIVNIASISGQRGGIGRGAYGASKGGVIVLTRVMAVELAPLGVCVNAVAPGPVDTEQSRGTHTPATRRSYLDRIPLRRYGTADEIAAGVLFLASEEASWVNGHILNVDGGFDAAGLIFDPNE
ncbi:MAG TPA: 3-oxoacyl-ACP reductase family protein [Opitutus sp.]|nr:3-oxoacyl-ACP reductase family protein [Opitutus sp.]